MRNWYLIVLVLLALPIIPAKAQEHIIQHQYSFQKKTVDDGLSNNRINAISQDHRGFIWFGTNNGLDRYDGRQIINYKHDPSEQGTISGNTIYSIFADSRGTLWIGHDNGLDSLDLANDRFVSFQPEAYPQGLGRIDAMVEDASGHLWIAGNTGLYRYDRQAEDIYQLPQSDSQSGMLPEGRISKILIDQKDNLWIAVYQKSLCYYDQKTGNITCYSNDASDPTSLSGNQIERMYEDNSGNVWFGTMNNGLNKFNSGSKNFTRIVPDENDNYSTRVRAIFEDFEGNFFVGTRGGVYMRNPGSGEFFMYASTEHPFSTLSQNSILCSYIDATGSLWIGTFAGGVNYANLKRKPFVHYSARTDDRSFLSSPNVYAICEDNSGAIWVGTDNGLNRLDRRTGLFSVFLNDPNNPNSLSYNDVKTLASDSDGNVWVGTNRGGLNFYNRRTRRFNSYMHDDNIPGSISTDKIYGLHLDQNEDLWVLNGVGYLDILRKGSGEFEHTDIEPYYGIIEGKDKKIWIGGRGSIYSYNPNSDTFKEHPADSLLGDVYTLMESSDGEIWVGGETGIVIYSPKGDVFNRLEVEGFKFDLVYGVKEDRSGNVWVSTEAGLVKLGNALTDKANASVRVYTKNDGLQSKQFNYNAHYQSPNGEMMFGGINGFNIFDPSKIVDNDIPPFVAFTDLKVFNKNVAVGAEVNGDVVLAESIASSEQLRFSRHQSSFSIEFAGLHYAQPDANQYRYKLEGYDDDWTYTTAARNFAPFNNLPGGDYTLRVNASNVDGVWAPEDKTVAIEIIPPFWSTWPFRGAIVALLVGAVFWYMRWRAVQEREQKRLLNKKVDEATEMVSKQNEELQVQSFQLQDAVRETNVVVNQALESGNFDARIDLENKEGEWKALGESINNLFESVSGPFRSINEVVNTLAQGDLTSKFKGEAKGDIQKITDNLNKAIDNLSGLLGEISERAKWLKDSSAEMLLNGEQMQVSTNEIASAIAQMSNGAQEQVQKIDESSNLIEGVLSSSNKMGDQAESILNTAKQGAEKSSHGITLVDKLDATMKLILKSSTATNESVTSLTARSNEISSVLNIIKEIASQTNLLALNAAIEAAQAGESGRGFAVVADEIRKLAESSKTSTAEIEELITAVQNDTLKTAGLIEEMSTSIKEGEEATSHSLATFEEINQYYQETLEKSEMIVSATKQQTSDIRNVVNIISGVVVISEQTAAGTEETASSSSELSAGMKNYQDRSEQVSEVAEALQEKVGKFKL